MNQEIDSEPNGLLDLHCPYCGASFDQTPKGKKRCATCRNVVYVKQRWGDTRRRLVTKDEALKIEAEFKAKYADSVAAQARLAEELKQGADQDSEILEVPDTKPEDIGIIWYNSEDDQVCEKCTDMTGQWFPNKEAFRIAKEIHPDGSCRCVKHFDVGTPSEALVGPGKITQKMRPMTDEDRAEFDAFTQEHYGMSYKQFSDRVIGRILGKETGLNDKNRDEREK